jgi:hypothetical protein
MICNRQLLGVSFMIILENILFLSELLNKLTKTFYSIVNRLLKGMIKFAKFKISKILELI